MSDTKYVSPMIRSNRSLAFNRDSSDIDSLIMSNGIYDRYQMDWYNKFTRFGIIDPYNISTTTKEYIFITKPDLCLMNSEGSVHPIMRKYPFFIDAIRRYNQVAKQLQSSVSNSDGPFMAMLSNALTSTLDLPGISASMVESAGNVLGTKMHYRSTSVSSDEDFDFSLEFEDTKHLDIYMLFKMWDEYERLKWGGSLQFNNEDSQRWVNYTLDKVLHDQVSIYKIVVGDDGSRIIYWARMTGCIPTTVPREAFSDMNNNDVQKLTVSWKGHFIRDMDPIILNHFNILVSSKVNGRRDLPLYDIDNHHMDGRWASTPYIEKRTVNDKHKTGYEYFLKWKA